MPKVSTGQSIRITARIYDDYAIKYYKMYKNFTAAAQASISVYPYIREYTLNNKIKGNFILEELKYLFDIIHSEYPRRFLSSPKIFIDKIHEIEKITHMSEQRNVDLESIIEKISNLDDVSVIVLSEFILSVARTDLKILL